MKKKIVSENNSFNKAMLLKALSGAVEFAMAETVRCSKKNEAEVKKMLGGGSFEHTNFRFFLAPKIVEVLNTYLGEHSINRAWVYDLDTTEADPAAGDTAGDGSPCDNSMGENLHGIMQVDQVLSIHNNILNVLSESLISILDSLGIVMSRDYLKLNFYALKDIEQEKGETWRVKSLYYPATELSFQ